MTTSRVTIAILLPRAKSARFTDPMPSSNLSYAQPSGAPSPVVREEHIEYGFIGKLQGLKYDYRADIRDRAALEANFREKLRHSIASSSRMASLPACWMKW